MKVVVIGAGLSGLAAAKRLQEAGHEALILEANDRPGGRCKAVRRDGFIVDTCPEIASASYRRWMDLVRSAGLEHDIVKVPMVIGMQRNGRLHNIDIAQPLSLPFTPLLSFGAKLKFARGILGMFNDIRAIPSNLLEVIALDDPARTAEDIALNAFGPEVAQYLIDPLMRVIAGSKMNLVSALMVPYALSDWTAMVTLRGGLDRLPKAVAAKLNIRYETQVGRIHSNLDNVTIEYTDAAGVAGSLNADKCIITAQFDDAERMYPRLTEISGDYKQKLQFMRMVDIKLAYSKAPNSKASTLMFPYSENPEVNMMSLAHNKSPDRVPAGHGLISIVTEHLDYDRMAALGDEEIVAWARRQVETLYPEVKGHFLFHYVGRQPRTCCFPDPGFFQRTLKLWEAVGKEPHVHLGGDIFNYGSMEAAVGFGERAVDRLLGAKR